MLFPVCCHRRRDLTIQHRAKHGQHTQHLCDRREASSRVVPGPGRPADAPALDIGDDPVPVVLDLMHPCLVSGRRGRGANELRTALVITAALRHRMSRHAVTPELHGSRKGYSLRQRRVSMSVPDPSCHRQHLGNDDVDREAQLLR